MMLAVKFAGYSWGDADKFRKAMGKKIPELMAEQKEKFFKGCKEFGGLEEKKIKYPLGPNRDLRCLWIQQSSRC